VIRGAKPTSRQAFSRDRLQERFVLLLADRDLDRGMGAMDALAMTVPW
jgi:hypothetical protein